VPCVFRSGPFLFTVLGYFNRTEKRSTTALKDGNLLLFRVLTTWYTFSVVRNVRKKHIIYLDIFICRKIFPKKGCYTLFDDFQFMRYMIIICSIGRVLDSTKFFLLSLESSTPLESSTRLIKYSILLKNKC